MIQNNVVIVLSFFFVRIEACSYFKPLIMSKFTILIVEDEEAICHMLQLVLQQANFEVQVAEDVDSGQLLLEQQLPDLILLDWMLPEISGVEWAKRLRKKSLYQDLPIILLTARGEEEDKIKGLEVGADDYVTKPFSPKELIARIKAVLRRSGKNSDLNQIIYNDLTLDIEQHQLLINKQQLDVSPTEFRLMQFFMTHPNKVYSRTQLLDHVWGRSVYIEERTVDVHIRRLRRILATYDKQDVIQTVRGFGYRFASAKEK